MSERSVGLFCRKVERRGLKKQQHWWATSDQWAVTAFISSLNLLQSPVKAGKTIALLGRSLTLLLLLWWEHESAGRLLENSQKVVAEQKLYETKDSILPSIKTCWYSACSVPETFNQMVLQMSSHVTSSLSLPIYFPYFFLPVGYFASWTAVFLFFRLCFFSSWLRRLQYNKTVT